MKKLFKITVLSLFVGLSQLMFTSCSKDDKPPVDYKGENKLELSSTVQSLEDGSGEELTVNIFLTKAIEKNLDLEFAFDNNNVDGKELISFKDSKITIPTGKKEATLVLKASDIPSINKSALVNIKLKSSSDNNVKLLKDFAVTITPKIVIEGLTDEQVDLLKHYKEKGLDLFPIIGKINVNTKVLEPGGANYNPYLESTIKDLSGTTIITLSDKATKEKPILKMINNPMGIKDYLYGVFRNVTILNTEYWANTGEEWSPENFKILVNLIDISADRAEELNVILDDIELNFDNNNIHIIGDAFDSYGDPIKVVPFEFTYSAWDRLKKLVEEGNQDAIKVEEEGYSTNPDKYLNLTTIVKDANGKDGHGNSTNDYFLESKGTYNKETKELTFEFIMDHADADNYSVYRVEYTPNK